MLTALRLNQDPLQIGILMIEWRESSKITSWLFPRANWCGRDLERNPPPPCISFPNSKRNVFVDLPCRS